MAALHRMNSYPWRENERLDFALATYSWRHADRRDLCVAGGNLYGCVAAWMLDTGFFPRDVNTMAKGRNVHKHNGDSRRGCAPFGVPAESRHE